MQRDDLAIITGSGGSKLVEKSHQAKGEPRRARDRRSRPTRMSSRPWLNSLSAMRRGLAGCAACLARLSRKCAAPSWPAQLTLDGDCR